MVIFVPNYEFEHGHGEYWRIIKSYIIEMLDKFTVKDLDRFFK